MQVNSLPFYKVENLFIKAQDRNQSSNLHHVRRPWATDRTADCPEFGWLRVDGIIDAWNQKSKELIRVRNTIYFAFHCRMRSLKDASRTKTALRSSIVTSFLSIAWITRYAADIIVLKRINWRGILLSADHASRGKIRRKCSRFVLSVYEQTPASVLGPCQFSSSPLLSIVYCLLLPAIYNVLHLDRSIDPSYQTYWAPLLPLFPLHLMLHACHVPMFSSQ